MTPDEKPDEQGAEQGAIGDEPQEIAAEGAVGEQEAPAAQLHHSAQVVADEQNADAVRPHLPDAVQALHLERQVAHRQHLVDDEQLG